MTISRRALLRHGAGVVGGIPLAGCIVLDTARRQSVADPIVAPETYSAPGPMLIDAERVRTVDIHAHCDVSEALALLGADANGVIPPVKGVKEHFIVDRALSERIVHVQNEKIAELCAVEFSDPRFFSVGPRPRSSARRSSSIRRARPSSRIASRATAGSRT